MEQGPEAELTDLDDAEALRDHMNRLRARLLADPKLSERLGEQLRATATSDSRDRLLASLVRSRRSSS